MQSKASILPSCNPINGAFCLTGTDLLQEGIQREQSEALKQTVLASFKLAATERSHGDARGSEKELLSCCRAAFAASAALAASKLPDHIRAAELRV